MTGFLIAASLLVACTLLFILPPLLRKTPTSPAGTRRDELNLSVLRDQMRELDADLAAGTLDAAAYRSSCQELERRVAEDVSPAPTSTASAPVNRIAALLLALAVPAGAAALYVAIGTPAALDPANLTAPPEQNHSVSSDEIAAMVEKLAQKLKNKPGDAEGWSMLARSYYAMSRYSEAADAYARLTQLIPDNAEVLGNYADALGMAQGKNLQGEPEKIIARALAADPKNIKALALAGSAAFERRDYPGAILHWKKILAEVPDDSDAARSVLGNIGEAQTLIGGAGTEAPAGTGAAPSTPVAKAASSPAAAMSVEGIVELDAALRAKSSDSDTVFIFARAAEGPRAPLAVLRKQVKDLPFSFTLDDSMSVVPNVKLSSAAMIVVGARIARSGNATPQTGDFEGLSAPVPPGTKNIRIRIDTQRQ